MEADPNIMWQPLVGHKAQQAAVEQAFVGSRMPHAWLLTGPNGIGKAHFAKQLAAAIIAYDDTQSALFGDKPAFSMGYDETQETVNQDTARQVIQGAHGDFLSISAVQDEKNKSGAIKVEQIRSLIPFFSHKSATGGWRVAIIDSLDDVNVQGANAMLKIVEEPPEKTVILLLATNAGAVLPTIRSRCRHLPFDPLSLPDQMTILQRYLPEADDDALQALAQFSGGSLGYALQVSETDALDLYQASCLVLAKSDSKAHHLLEISSRWGAAKQKALLPIATQAFSRLLSAAALQSAAQNLTDAFLPCETELITLLAKSAPPATLAELHGEMHRALQQGTRAYLDMASVFLSLFDKIHSIAHQK